MTSPYGNNYHYADHVDSGTFAFTAAESGDYMACYWAVDHKPPVTLSIEFDWKSGVAAKDWSKVAKKGQVEVSIFGFLSLNRILHNWPLRCSFLFYFSLFKEDAFISDACDR